MNIIRMTVLTGIALLTAGAALADTPALPHQKLGLWQHDFTMGGKNISDQICLDAPTENKLWAAGSQMANKMCQSQHVTRNLDGTWNVDSICEVRPGWKNASHVVITGDFNSKYRAVTDTTTTGSPMAVMNGVHHSVMSASWLGPCKPGQKGGDLTMSNGTKVNILNPAPAPH